MACSWARVGEGVREKGGGWYMYWLYNIIVGLCVMPATVGMARWPPAGKGPGLDSYKAHALWSVWIRGGHHWKKRSANTEEKELFISSFPGCKCLLNTSWRELALLNIFLGEIIPNWAGVSQPKTTCLTAISWKESNPRRIGEVRLNSPANWVATCNKLT